MGQRRGRPVESESQCESRLKKVKIPGKDIVLFARQMTALYRGGIPLVQCLEILSEQNENPALAEILGDVSRKISRGLLFSTSLAQYPNAFPKILQVMCRIGEESGGLDKSLEKVAGWLERDFDLRAKIKSALSYPFFILALTGTLTLGLFYGVMPAFLKIFEDMKVDLPFVTEVVLGFTRALQSPVVWLLLPLAAGFIHWQTRVMSTNEPLKRQGYEFLLLIPIWGKILHHGSLSRFCGAAQTLLETGVNLMLALKLSGAVCGSPVIEHDVEAMIDAVKHGESVSSFMDTRPDIYSRTTINFLAAGEEASNLPAMMRFSAAYHALEAESQIDALKVAIEPLMLAVIAIVVGGLVLSIFLPLYGFLDKL